MTSLFHGSSCASTARAHTTPQRRSLRRDTAGWHQPRRERGVGVGASWALAASSRALLRRVGLHGVGGPCGPER
eukprot:8309003-Pyramimonas_sp.AAC.2